MFDLFLCHVGSVGVDFGVLVLLSFEPLQLRLRCDVCLAVRVTALMPSCAFVTALVREFHFLAKRDLFVLYRCKPFVNRHIKHRLGKIDGFVFQYATITVNVLHFDASSAHQGYSVNTVL